MKLCMKHQRFKLIVFSSNDKIYFTAKSNIATLAFIQENVTMMDILEFIASCDLEFGILCYEN